MYGRGLQMEKETTQKMIKIHSEQSPGIETILNLSYQLRVKRPFNRLCLAFGVALSGC